MPHAAPARANLTLPSRPHGRGRFACLLPLLCLLLSVSCAALPPPLARPVSSAISDPQQTTLGRIVAASLTRPGVSAFQLEITGDQAFDDRLALIDRAERSLDLQYYIIEHDPSVHTLFAHLRQAAARGVRVRLLVDDLNTSGFDPAYLHFDAQRNIEVRIFNPFPAGRFSVATRFLASLSDFRRLSRRMHNKMLVADNSLAVTGGRNLGDQYFVRSPDSNFVDLDIVSAGAIVRQLSAAFDRYWNDPLAYPIAVVASAGGAAAPPLQGAGQAQPPPGSLRAQLAQGRLTLSEAPVRLLVDKPAKISAVPNGSDDGAVDPGLTRDDLIIDDVAALIRSAQRELVIISPYLVPGPRGIALLRELSARGVRLRILTNSLAATDAPAVHLGYARYRPQLLELGAELYEQQPAIAGLSHRFGSFGSSRACLHTKALVVDGQRLFIGSMNMDPRSAYENTELGLVVRSELLARQVLQLFNEETTRFSYRVQFGPDHKLVWSALANTQTNAQAAAKGAVKGTGNSAANGAAQSGGKIQQWHDEPGVTFKLRLELMLLGPFAPEELL